MTNRLSKEILSDHSLWQADQGAGRQLVWADLVGALRRPASHVMQDPATEEGSHD